MGTPPRLDYDGAFQHVYNRGARRDLIFFDDTDRHAWLRSVADVCLHRGAEIHAWCLMGNHFHLLLRSPGNVRDVMRDAGSQYVKAFNRRHGLDGPLHTSRYKNEIIESDKQFVTTSRYIHRNPLEIHSGPLRRYQWSSYPFFLAPSAAPRWLHTARTLELVARNGMHEYFDPNTGEGLGADQFTWTAALSLDLLRRG